MHTPKKEPHLPAQQGKSKKQKLTPLQKAQARFNKLVKEIEAAELENKNQHEQNDRFHQLYQQKVLPLLRQYANEKLLLIRQFDAILENHKFSKSQQRSYAQWVVETLQEVAPYSEEAADLLEERTQVLYDLLPPRQKEKVAKQQEQNSAESFTYATNEEESGYFEEPDPFEGFQEYFQYQKAQPAKPAAPEIDEIGPLYKELAKKLHPDLEQDEQAKAWKHEQMQLLTEARKNRDLFTMLRIKGNLESTEATQDLHKLERYNKLLQQKLQQLRSQFSRIIAGSMLVRGTDALFENDPEKEINKEVRNLKKTIRNIREDRPLIQSREHLEQLLDSLKWDY